jgi:hypothetical protein
VIFSGDRVRGAWQIGEVAMPQMSAGFPSLNLIAHA